LKATFHRVLVYQAKASQIPASSTYISVNYATLFTMDSDQANPDIYFAELNHPSPDVFDQEFFLGYDNGTSTRPSDQAEIAIPTPLTSNAESVDPIRYEDYLHPVDGANDPEPFNNPLALDDAGFDSSEQILSTETASSTRPAQLANAVEDDFPSLHDFDTDPDPSSCAGVGPLDSYSLLKPGCLTQAVQGARPEDNGFPHFLSPDLTQVAAPWETSTSTSEQLWLPDLTNAAAPAEAAESANFASLACNGAIFDDQSDLTQPPVPFASPSRDVVSTFTIPGDHLEATSGDSLSHGRYAPIQPKAPAIFQSNILQSIGSSQDSSKEHHSSSETTLTTHTSPPIAKDKRRRSQSPEMRRSGVPDGLCCVFAATAMPRAGKKQQKRPRKAKSAKACLRCQFQKLPVSRYYVLKGLRADMSEVLGCAPMRAMRESLPREREEIFPNHGCMETLHRLGYFAAKLFP